MKQEIQSNKAPHPGRSAVARLVLILVICALAIFAQQGTIAVVHTFGSGTDGANPATGLLQMPSRNYVGMTFGIGVHQSTPGTVFWMTPAGVVTTLFTFAADGSQGTWPQGLMQASDGNFYGTMFSGGAHNAGSVFRLTPAAIYTKLHDFGGTNDGDHPVGALVEAFDGNLYGVTQAGGVNNGGTIYRIGNGAVATIYSFFKNNVGGMLPSGTLLLRADGMLYGTTNSYVNPDGSQGNGSTFRIDTAGNLTTVAILNQNRNEFGISSPPVLGSDGNLYFVDPTCGEFGQGCIFQGASNGSVTIVYSFTGGADGSFPVSVIQASDGKFYGTTGTAVPPNSLFQFDPGSGTVTSHAFNPGVTGYTPEGTPLQAAGGDLRGTTQHGGSNNAGTAYRLNLSLPLPAPSILGFRPMAGSAGAAVTVWGGHFTDVSAVTVNGTPAKFQNVTSGFVRLVVPAGATSGPIAITTTNGTANSATSFQVK